MSAGPVDGAVRVAAPADTLAQVSPPFARAESLPAAVAHMREVALAGWDLLLAAECVGCGAGGRGWCRECDQGLGRPLLSVRRELGGQRLTGWAAAEHAGAPAAAVTAYKDAGYRQLAAPLARALARSLAAAVLGTPGGLAGPVAVVPVPSRRAAVRARGGDTLGELARRAAGHLRGAGLPVVLAPVLVPTRLSADQVGLNARARAANMAGGFGVRGRWPAVRVVVVVDDVVTTGATAAAAVSALRWQAPRELPEIQVAAVTVARLGGHGSS